jgi:hypothetical protein
MGADSFDTAKNINFINYLINITVPVRFIGPQ